MKQFAHRINIYSIRFISWCFATFLLLSYMKVVGVSFDLLVPMLMCKVNGSSLGQYLNYHDAADQACLEQFRIQSYLAANLTCMFIRAKFSWKASLGQALPSRKKPDISLSIMNSKAPLLYIYTCTCIIISKHYGLPDCILYVGRLNMQVTIHKWGNLIWSCCEVWGWCSW